MHSRLVASRLLAVPVLAAGLLLAGPAAPGVATVTLPPPSVVTIPGSALGSMGATSATIGSAAATASSTGAGMTVTMGGTAAAGGVAGAARSAGGVAAAVVGAGALGWGLGRFIGTNLCNSGVEIVCWPRDATHAVNGDAPATQPGVTSTQSLAVNETATTNFTIAASGRAGWVSVTRLPNDATNCPAGTGVSSDRTGRCWRFQGSGDAWQSTASGYAKLLQASGAYGGMVTYRGVLTTTTGTWTILRNQKGTDYGDGSWLTVLGIADRVTTSSAVDSWQHKVYLESGPAPADPPRTWLSRGQCVKGATVSWAEQSSAVFYESQPSWPKYPDVSCPSGLALKRLEVRKLTPALAVPGNDVVVWEWDYPADPADAGTPDAGKHPAEKWTECAAGTCVLRLWKLGTVAAEDLDCFDVPSACRDWWSERAASPATYQCRYGTHVVALTECYLYRPTFETATAAEQGTRTEDDPAHANPDGTLPAGEPGTATDPGAGDGTCPPKVGFLSFLNPFWLFETLKCALVPSRAGLEAGWASSAVDWCTTAPGVLMCAVDELLSPWAEVGQGVDEADCLGGSVPLPDIRPDRPDGEMHPWQACNEAAATISGFWIPLSSGAVYLSSFLLGARMLARTIGADDAVPA